jgi:hypothetical protein
MWGNSVWGFYSFSFALVLAVLLLTPEFIAAVWELPQATEDQLRPEAIWTGEERLVALLLPNWPWVFAPHRGRSRTAETRGGSVHESPAPKADAKTYSSILRGTKD